MGKIGYGNQQQTSWVGKGMVYLALIVVGSIVYSHLGVKEVPSGNTVTPPPVTIPSSDPTKITRSQFKCDGRQYCSDMTSRAEAEFFLKNCPNTKMDGDHDGIPCENDSRF